MDAPCGLNGQCQFLHNAEISGNRPFCQNIINDKEQMGEHHYGEERAETEEEQAEEMVREGLKRLGWKEQDLAARRKGDGQKLKLALRLRKETTASVKWIAQRLQMGTWTPI